MRKITQNIVHAFIAGYTRTIGNSHTDGDALFLHGNRIAEKREDGIYISNAGWSTVTTKERLNGLLDSLGKPGIFQRNWEWFRMSESGDTWKDATPFPEDGSFVKA